MMEEVDIHQHLDKFNKITMELDSLEVKIEEEDKAFLLLASLPLSFDNIVTTHFFRKVPLRVDQVVTALLMNETQRCNNRCSSEGPVAMV